MEELGIPELTSEQTETVCTIAEEATRQHVLSKVGAKNVEKLNVVAEAEGIKPVRLTIDADVTLSESAEKCDVQQLVKEAVKAGFAAAEQYLRELRCLSPK